MIYKIEFQESGEPDFIKVRRSDLSKLQIALFRFDRHWRQDRWAILVLLVINLFLWWQVL